MSLAITMPVLLIEKLDMRAAVPVVSTGIAVPLANSIVPGRRTFRNV